MFNGMPVQKVFGDNPENKEDTVGIVRNDQIRKDRMGVSTTADNPHDFDCMVNRASLDEINQISLVRSMSGARMRGPTNRTGSHFRAESSHKRIKQ